MTTPDIRPPEEIPALHRYLATHTEKYQPSGIWRHRRKMARWLIWRSRRTPSSSRDAPLVSSSPNDVTERRRAEEALRHHALHDALTGLPNRTLFAERLARALERVQARLPRIASPSCISISTDSRRSTTASAISKGIRSSSRGRTAWRDACARRTRSPASAATSSSFLLEELVGPGRPRRDRPPPERSVGSANHAARPGGRHRGEHRHRP